MPAPGSAPGLWDKAAALLAPIALAIAREAEHRTKNILATVQAAVRLSHAGTVEDFKKLVVGRIDALAPAVQVLSLVPGLAVDVVESSCCGMAGTFGFEARFSHFPLVGLCADCSGGAS